MVQIAIDQAIQDGCTNLYYWVSTENGRAIGFAINAGFRLTSERRTSRIENREFGDQEIALVLSLANDPAGGGHLGSISAQLEARSPLTEAHGRLPGTGMMSRHQFDGGSLAGKDCLPHSSTMSSMMFTGSATRWSAVTAIDGTRSPTWPAVLAGGS
jgi:hypothetical protein